MYCFYLYLLKSDLWIDLSFAWLAIIIFHYLHNGVSGQNAAQHVGKEHGRGSASTVQKNIFISTEFYVAFRIAQ